MPDSAYKYGTYGLVIDKNRRLSKATSWEATGKSTDGILYSASLRQVWWCPTKIKSVLQLMKITTTVIMKKSCISPLLSKWYESLSVCLLQFSINANGFTRFCSWFSDSKHRGGNVYIEYFKFVIAVVIRFHYGIWL